jgi:hypothetical protein
LWQAWHPEAGLPAPASLNLGDAGHHANRLLEPEDGRVEAAGPVVEGEQNRSADGGMTGERKLPRRREDAQAGAVTLVLRRQDEDRLGEVELARDPLHALGIEAISVEHHGQGVSGQGLVRENVEGDETAAHRSS